MFFEVFMVSWLKNYCWSIGLRVVIKKEVQEMNLSVVVGNTK